MPLEQGTTISQLHADWPISTDDVSQGDEHLRLIKNVLKNQFPGEGGQGLSKPITTTEEDLNNIKANFEKVYEKIDSLHPVGTVVFRLDDTNPNTIYPGTWSLITGDAVLTFGDGTVQTGDVVGDNEVDVPLLQHSHGATFKGEELPPHGHNVRGVGGESRSGNQFGDRFLNGGYVSGYISTTSAGTPAGTVTLAEAGEEDASINVKGATIAVNVWKRVA